jgi:hypothetical protein
MLMKKRTPEDSLDPYETNDIDVAATLVCKGYTLEKIAAISSKKAAFIFTNHSALKDAVDGFWSNRIEVHPLEFANTRKNLKSRIYAMQRDY